MNDLLGWLKRTDAHPLIASSVFHYELEFIHPFSDGNGRIGRLWQTLILSHWKPILAYLPVESVIRERQDDYYAALGQSDKSGQATDQVSDQVQALLSTLGTGTFSALELMEKLALRHRPTFRKNYLNPAIEAGLIERTPPDKPNIQNQKYRRVFGN